MCFAQSEGSRCHPVLGVACCAGSEGGKEINGSRNRIEKHCVRSHMTYSFNAVSLPFVEECATFSPITIASGVSNGVIPPMLNQY